MLVSTKNNLNVQYFPFPKRTLNCMLKLYFRRKGKQYLPVRNPSPLTTPEALN